MIKKMIEHLQRLFPNEQYHEVDTYSLELDVQDAANRTPLCVLTNDEILVEAILQAVKDVAKKWLIATGTGSTPPSREVLRRIMIERPTNQYELEELLIKDAEEANENC